MRLQLREDSRLDSDLTGVVAGLPEFTSAVARILLLPRGSKV